jgi:hypothetical protein
MVPFPLLFLFQLREKGQTKNSIKEKNTLKKLEKIVFSITFD